jgi:hypothetical protein
LNIEGLTPTKLRNRYRTLMSRQNSAKNPLKKSNNAKNPPKKSYGHSMSSDAVQCQGYKTNNQRCLIHSLLKYPEADPLRSGGKFCTHHVDMRSSLASPHPMSEHAKQPCYACTFANPPTSATCEVCETPL